MNKQDSFLINYLYLNKTFIVCKNGYHTCKQLYLIPQEVLEVKIKNKQFFDSHFGEIFLSAASTAYIQTHWEKSTLYIYTEMSCFDPYKRITAVLNSLFNPL